MTDITEVTELREQLTLKKNLESMGEMSAGLAHEFKNALATPHKPHKPKGESKGKRA